jgi:ABC-type glutathione transport system ATPase component
MILFAHQVRRLLDTGCAILIITHDFELIAECCDRIVWMEDGFTTKEYDRSNISEMASRFGYIGEERTVELCSR